MAGKTTQDARRKPNRNTKNAKLAPVKAIKVGIIDYKDIATLRKFVSDRGKIRSRRITGVSVQEQRLIARAVKNAREMALMPYAGAGRN
jgi:small subunit ribosomal protein S18